MFSEIIMDNVGIEFFFPSVGNGLYFISINYINYYFMHALRLHLDNKDVITSVLIPATKPQGLNMLYGYVLPQRDSLTGNVQDIKAQIRLQICFLCFNS